MNGLPRGVALREAIVAAPVAAVAALIWNNAQGDLAGYALTFALYFAGAFLLIGPLARTLGDWIWPVSHDEHVANCTVCITDHLIRYGRLAAIDGSSWKEHAGRCTLCHPRFHSREPEDFQHERTREGVG